MPILGTRGGTEALLIWGPGEYYANISYLDQLGRLLAYLEKEGYERSSCLPAITARSPTIG